MEIQELPDYKAHCSETYKYMDEPLLEYVWQVANRFKPDFDGEAFCESRAPIIFANRYLDSSLSNEEKYARYLEINPYHNLDYAKEYYAEQPEINTSFKEKFFGSNDILQTLKAFNLDPIKFWYLLLFVNDLTEDVCTNAPSLEPSQIDKVSELSDKLSAATKITLEHNGRKSYETQDEFTLSVLKASVDYYIQTYNDILESSENREECKARLEALGLKGAFQSRRALNYEEQVNLEKSHKTRVFAALFQYFLEDMVADRDFVKRSKEKISIDKLLLISRLTHIVGLQGEDYYEQYTENGNQNRKLSNLLSRYRNEPLPSMIGRLYSGRL